MKPYGKRIKVKPVIQDKVGSIILYRKKTTEIGEVMAVGDLVKSVKEGDKVIYNPEPNTMIDGFYYTDESKVSAVI